MKFLSPRVGLLAVVVIAFMLGACSTSNSVVSSSFLQKRKYNKGFHVSLGHAKSKKAADAREKAVVEKAQPIESEPLAMATPESKPATRPEVVKPAKQSTPIAPAATPTEHKAGTAEKAERPARYRKPFPIQFNGFSKTAQGIRPVFITRSETATIAPPKPQNGEVNPFALVSMICGILGFLLLFVTFFPFMMGTAAVIFGAIGLGQISRDSERYSGRGFALAGLILGALTILIFWALVIIVIIILGTAVAAI